jgi:hypothetical protein
MINVMKNSIGLCVFGTFGHPFGFQPRFFEGAKFSQNLDLNANAIELNSESELFVVKKELSNGDYRVCCCIYTFAREPQSSRNGSFIGSGVILTNCTFNGEDIYECLMEFHNDTIRNPQNIINNVLQVNKATDLIVYNLPKLDKIKESVSPIEAKSLSIDHKDSILIASSSNLNESQLRCEVGKFFAQSINQMPNIGTMYFTTNAEVINYVKYKNLIKVISADEFEQKLTEKEKKKKQPQLINEAIKDSTFETVDKENISPKQTNIRKWKKPNNNWKSEELEKRIDEHNYLFDNYRQLCLDYNDLLNHSKLNTNKLISVKSKISKKDFVSKLLGIKILSKLTTNTLSLLLVGIVGLFVILWFGSIYFFYDYFFPTKTVNTNTNTNQNLASSPTVRPTISVVTDDNDDVLKQNEMDVLNRELELEMKVSKVIEIAGRQNKNDVGVPSENQKNIIIEKLKILNPNCFEEDKEELVLKCKPLKRFPKNK